MVLRSLKYIGITVLLLTCAPVFAARHTQNVVLVTIDGLRIQEFFGGYDESIASDTEGSGIYEPEVTRERFDRPDRAERRMAVMPFFWGTLAPQGIVLGDQQHGSKVLVENDQWFSYPGYSEILTGRPEPEVKSNDPVRYPHETVLEYARKALELRPFEVAEFGSWDGFRAAAASKDDVIFTNGAYDAVPAPLSTPRTDFLVQLRKHVLQTWEEGSDDAVTFEIAMEYLRKNKPRVLWIGFGQTDDWAHARRYDRLLNDLHMTDDLLRELWTTLQSMDQYRGKTSLVITTDHGRGRTAKDWVDHDAGIPGSGDIWMAVIGPDTPDTGIVAPSETVHQGSAGSTVLELLGLDYRTYNKDARPPVPGAVQ